PERVGDACVGQVALVELGLAGHLAQRPDLDAGLVHVDHEVGHAPVLGDVGIGAREQQAPLGMVGQARPLLLPVDDPLVAVTDGRRRQARHVRARARLAEELAPHLLAGEQRAEPSPLLLLGAVGGDRRRGHAVADAEGRDRPARLHDALVDGALERRGQPEAAVALREPDEREAGVELRAEEARRRLAEVLRHEPVGQVLDPGGRILCNLCQLTILAGGFRWHVTTPSSATAWWSTARGCPGAAATWRSRADGSRGWARSIPPTRTGCSTPTAWSWRPASSTCTPTTTRSSSGTRTAPC